MEFRFFYCPQIPDDLAYLKDKLYIYDRDGNPLCDFFAIILDNENPNDVKIVGTAKAEIYDSDTSEQILKDISPYLKRKDKPNSNDVVVNIQSVIIEDPYKGKGLCKQLVKFLMDNITKSNPSIRFFKIVNASETLDGIPACKCYVKSGDEQDYDVYFDTIKNHWLWGNYYEMKKMSKERCVGGEDMPREYMYVKPKKVGGKKKRKTCNKKINKNKNTKKNKSI